VKPRAGKHCVIAKRMEIFNMRQYRVSNFSSRNATKETNWKLYYKNNYL